MTIHTNFKLGEQQLLTNLGLSSDVFASKIMRIQAKRGDVLFSPGDDSKAFLILLSGCIRVDLITKSDRQIVLYRVKEAQTCLITTTALLKSEVYFARGTAETDIQALALPAADFTRALLEAPKLAQHVLTDYAHRVESLVGLIDRLTSKDVKYDLAVYLLDKIDEQGAVHMTQANIASNIGTAREVVARKLALFEKQGYIKRQRGCIHILDKNGLRDVVT